MFREMVLKGTMKDCFMRGRVLIGMCLSSNYFMSKNKLLLESEVFKKRMESLDLFSFLKKIDSLGAYEAPVDAC